MDCPSKRCFKCAEVKPLDEFYAHAQMADGHLNKCKDCTRRDARGNRRNNPERHRAYDRSRYANNPRRRTAINERAQQDNERWPKKRAARNAVSNALRDGRLEKPERCERCGSTDHQIEGHHADYDRLLDVEWLCTPCHSAIG